MLEKDILINVFESQRSGSVIELGSTSQLVVFEKELWPFLSKLEDWGFITRRSKSILVEHPVTRELIERINT